MKMNCIDTHIHVWNFNRAQYAWLEGNTSILNRSYLLSELEEEREKTNVSFGVLVQAANTVIETGYMLEVAEETEWMKGVVGWLPLMDPSKVDDLLMNGYGKHPLFKGVRHLIHDEPEPGWLLQPEVMESLHLLAKNNIPYDVVGILPEHLQTVLQLADKVPGLQLVLDHLNQPPINTNERFGKWGELITELAHHPQVHAKISGLGTTTGKGRNWNKEDILPYVQFVLEHLGISRCFCGGDWPVSLLAGSYSHAWKVYEEVLTTLLDDKDTADVLYYNAINFYKLDLE